MSEMEREIEIISRANDKARDEFEAMQATIRKLEQYVPVALALTEAHPELQYGYKHARHDDGVRISFTTGSLRGVLIQVRLRETETFDDLMPLVAGIEAEGFRVSHEDDMYDTRRLKVEDDNGVAMYVIVSTNESEACQVRTFKKEVDEYELTCPGEEELVGAPS